MNLKNLFNKGKQVVDERGGVESLKEDAQELQGIAKSKGSLADKAKEAAAAVKDPGAPGEEPGQQPHKAQGDGKEQRPQHQDQGHPQGDKGDQGQQPPA